MAGKPIVLGVLASSYEQLQLDVTAALTNVAPDRIISVSYAVSRAFGFLWLKHHALIIISGE